MLPIPVVCTEYTAILSGRATKVVPCERCATEYVYTLEREGEGRGKSFYLLNEDGAKAQAQAGAEESLSEYLNNDFDAVPCPVCGHYQRYMFPKLYEGSAWIQLARLVVLAIGCPAAVGVLYWAGAYALHPRPAHLVRLGGALALLPVLGLIDYALRAAERARADRFDPNTEDQQARIEKGRSRAVTRAEAEAAQQRERAARDQFIAYLRQQAQQDRANAEQGPAPPDSARPPGAAPDPAT